MCTAVDSYIGYIHDILSELWSCFFALSLSTNSIIIILIKNNVIFIVWEKTILV